MKTKEELDDLREAVKARNEKLCELNAEELAQVSGGSYYPKNETYPDGVYSGQGDPYSANSDFTYPDYQPPQDGVVKDGEGRTR